LRRRLSENAIASARRHSWEALVRSAYTHIERTLKARES
jgi:hypothetical protein